MNSQHHEGQGFLGATPTAAAALLVLMALSSMSCGTRVSKEEAVRGGEGPTLAANQMAGGPGGGDATGDQTPLLTRPSSKATAAPGHPVPGDAARTATSRSREVNPNRAAGSPTNGAQSGTANAAARGKPTTQEHVRPNVSGVVPPDAGSGGTGAASAELSPVLTASVGTYSGPIGAQIRTILVGTQLWVKYINDKGGLNGHKVKLLVYDDAGDPGRHRAHVQEAIEHKRVLAFLEQGGAISGGASVDYITAKRVPVLGSEGATAGFYTSPMYFPQQSHGDALALTLVLAAADQAIPEGKEKLGVLVCAESQTCSDLDRVASRQAESAGFDVVYRGKASLAQPDYTAECLAARNAGVELMLVLFDGTSIERLAASCARQSYRPTFVSGAGILLDRFKEDPNLDGFIGASQVFPWFQSGTPGVDEFHHAVQAYGGRGILTGVGAATGWVSGKLLEKAGANLPEPPTTDALLRGLWAIKGDTLGGITQPLTFVENQPATPLSCWFNLRTKKGAWVTPDGFKLHCKD